MSWRRVRAIFRKELREYRRNRSLIMGMAIFPLVFSIQPLVAVFGLSTADSSTLAHEHVLPYMLGIPTLVPIFVAAYAVVGERQQGTLEPVLTTPIRHEEFLLGKALAALVPSVVVAYGVFAVFLACVELFARPGVAAALIQGPDLLAQLLFAPLLATWSIWVGIGISAGVCGGADRAQRNSRFARAGPRPCGTAVARRRAWLADHGSDVRPGTTRDGYTVMRT